LRPTAMKHAQTRIQDIATDPALVIGKSFLILLGFPSCYFVFAVSIAGEPVGRRRGAGSTRETWVPPPKMTRFVSISTFFAFCCSCFWLSATIDVALGSGGKSLMNRLVFKKRPI